MQCHAIYSLERLKCVHQRGEIWPPFVGKIEEPMEKVLKNDLKFSKSKSLSLNLCPSLHSSQNSAHKRWLLNQMSRYRLQDEGHWKGKRGMKIEIRRILWPRQRRSVKVWWASEHSNGTHQELLFFIIKWMLCKDKKKITMDTRKQR